MKTEDEIRKGFAGRLVKALAVAGYPNDNQLRKHLSKRYGVTVENARKWVSGLSMPTIAKMALIAEDLNVDAAWLMAGQGQPVPLPKSFQHKEADDPALGEILSAYQRGGDAKREVLHLIGSLPESEMAGLLLVPKSIASKY